jgi:hypothetical protein
MQRQIYDINEPRKGPKVENKCVPLLGKASFQRGQLAKTSQGIKEQPWGTSRQRRKCITKGPK